VLGDRGGQGGIDHTRLDHRDPIDRIDLQDLVHRHHGEHDRPVDRVRGAGQTGPGPLRHHRYAMGRRRPDHRHHLGGAARSDHHRGHPGDAEVRLIPLVAAEQVGIGQHGGPAERGPQVVEKIRHGWQANRRTSTATMARFRIERWNSIFEKR
jgi:hypothetical protein